MIIKNFILKYKIYFILGLLGFLLISVFMIKNGKVSNNPVVVDAKVLEEKDNNEIDLETFSVDIKGAVKNPGVYRVVNGSNVSDVINLAGGLKSNATTININLSKKVSDEMVIYIYTKSEYNKLNTSSNESNIKTSEFVECQEKKTTPDISSCIKQDATIISSDNSSVQSDDNKIENSLNNESSSLININTASKDELMSLTGIGESKAECIIAYRSEVGLFKTIDEIKNVSGIGEALFDKIKNNITV